MVRPPPEGKVPQRPKLSRIAANGTSRPLEPPAGHPEPDLEASAVLSLADVQDDQDLPSPKPIPRESADDTEPSSGISSSGAWRMGSSGTVLRPREQQKPLEPLPAPPRVSGLIGLSWIAALCSCLPVATSVLPTEPWPISDRLRSALLFGVWALGVVLFMVVAVRRARMREAARGNGSYAFGAVLLVVAVLGLAPFLLVWDYQSGGDAAVPPMRFALAAAQVVLALVGAGLWALSIRRLGGRSPDASSNQSS